MLFNEFKKKVENKDFSDFVDYLSVTDKKRIVDEIVFQSFLLDEEVGLYKYNYFIKKMLEPTIIIKHLLLKQIDDLYIKDKNNNEILPEEKINETFELFSIFKEYLYELYPEYENDLKESLDYEIKYFNSIEYVVSKKINILISKIPDFKPEQITKFLNELSPKNRKLLEKAMVHNESNKIINKVQELAKDKI